MSRVASPKLPCWAWPLPALCTKASVVPCLPELGGSGIESKYLSSPTIWGIKGCRFYLCQPGRQYVLTCDLQQNRVANKMCSTRQLSALYCISIVKTHILHGKEGQTWREGGGGGRGEEGMLRGMRTLGGGMLKGKGRQGRYRGLKGWWGWGGEVRRGTRHGGHRGY